MNKDDALRLLIADDSINDAEVFVSVLRNAGHAVRPTHVGDLEELRETLNHHGFDLFLCGLRLEQFSLESAIQCINQNGWELPVIAVAEEDGPSLRLDVMRLGAVDLVCKADRELMQLVVERTFSQVRQKRRLRRVERALRETEKRCASLLDRSRDPIAYVHEGMHVYANRAYLEHFGHDTVESIEGMPLLDLVAPESQQSVKKLLRSLSRNGQETGEAEVKMLRQGEPITVSLDISQASIDGEPCTQVLIRDYSQTAVETRELEEQLDSLSKRDLVTGLLNRLHFSSELEDFLVTATDDEDSGGPSHGLLYLKLDDMETARQRLGSTGCDKVLAAFAGLVQKELEEDCLAGRFDDNVLTVFLPARGVHATMAMAEALRSAVEECIFDAGGRSFTTTVSVGAAMIGRNTEHMHQTLLDVETACDTAHHAGGNRIHLHGAGSGEDDEAEISAWEERLEDAMASGRFQLVYMPVASLGSDSQPRYEGRLRLRDEDGEIRGPAHFMSAVERCGLTATLDRWAVTTAVRQLAEATDTAPAGKAILFLKLGGATVNDPEFLPFVRDTLKRARLSPAQLNFQLNESEAVTRLREAQPLFRGLKELGCGLTLDHFGSGLNPFQLVKHLPVDYVKLDRTLMRDLGASEEIADKVRNLTQTANGMGVQVIAGYLEDAQTLARAWQHNVDLVQGTFIQPASPEMGYDFTGTVI